MKSILTILAVACSLATSAQDVNSTKDLEERIRLLEERIARLEGRVARAESRAASAGATSEAKQMQKVAGEHFAEERKKFKPEDIQRAEELYTRASALMRNGENAKPLLDSVVSTYPQLNRAGCAQLYRAPQETGQKKERLLKDCIERFSNCYYGDGAQVGPLAMLELAEYYQGTGRAPQDAQKLHKKIRKEYPTAVAHDGQLLVDKIF